MKRTIAALCCFVSLAGNAADLTAAQVLPDVLAQQRNANANDAATLAAKLAVAEATIERLQAGLKQCGEEIGKRAPR